MKPDPERHADPRSEPGRPTRRRRGEPRAPRSSARQGAIEARKSGRRPRVVIADPDADVLQSTALLVETLGCNPVQVFQPGELLDAIARTRPGLVLVETQFPGLNLAGLMASLRTDPATAETPVALFSASKDLAATAVRHGAWATLAKPFSMRELAHLVRRAVGPGPQGLAAAERTIERDVRDSFRELRNMLTALDNYLALLDQAEELSRPSRIAVRRLGELALRMEAKAEHMRSYVLSLMLPAVAPETRPPRARAQAVHSEGPAYSTADEEGTAQA